MKRFNRWFLVVAAIAAFAALPWMGCGEDDPTDPNGNGGGSSNNTLNIPPGQYVVSIVLTDCDNPTDTLGTLDDSPIFCTTQVVDAVFEGDPLNAPCPITVNGDSLRMRCTVTAPEDGNEDCVVTWRINAIGIRTATTWDISGTITRTAQVPTDCSTLPDCIDFSIHLLQTSSSVPPGCAHGDLNTMTVTVSEGLYAGEHELGGFATGSPNASTWDWFMQAYSDQNTLRVASAAAGFNGIGLSFDLVGVDPEALPQNQTLTMLLPNAASFSGGGGSAFGWNESRSDPFYLFSPNTGSGSVTINVATPGSIAGTFSLTMQGFVATGGPPTAASRTVTGEFNMVNDVPPIRTSLMEAIRKHGVSNDGQRGRQ